MSHQQHSIVSGIESDPCVCGGTPCIINTRIPIWVLVQLRRSEMIDADILKSYPTLHAKDLENAWSYEHAYRGEIDLQIAENEEPDVLSQLAFHGLRYRLRLVATSDELRQAANMALNAGIYSPALADVAVFLDNRLADIGPAYIEALRAMQISLPESEDECCWILLRHYIRKIASKTTSPRKYLGDLLDNVYYGCNLPSGSQYAGDSHDIHKLLGAYYGYDDLLERPDEVSYDGLYGEAAIAALDASVIAECVSWLQRHPPESQNIPPS